MISEKFTSKAMIFGSGVIIGIALTIIIGFLVGEYSYTDLPINVPRTFGNIRICAIENTDPENGITKSLIMKKDGLSFFYAELDKNNKVNNVAIVSPNNDVRFSMVSSTETGGWKNATYTYDKDHKTIGDEYIDFNFDGCFDIKEVFDSNGNKKSIFIPLGGQWVEVSRMKGGRAFVNGQSYVYTDISGWTIQK